MTIAAPLFAWIAAAAALVTVGLHLLAWRRPPESPLPTARFAPDVPVRTVSRALRPSDLVLLALRVLLVLLVGGALAGVSIGSRASDTARVIVVDRSRGLAASATIADSARAVFRAGDALVLFDSTAREIAGSTRDSISVGPALTRGSLSAALIVAIRAARRLEREHDAVEIVIVSPFARDELDGATAPIRRTWPGLVRVVRAGSAPPNDSATTGRPTVRAVAGDAVAAALALAGDMPSGANVRVVRDAVTGADSSWALEGHVVVLWPAAASAPSWARRPSSDTTFAIAALTDSDDPQQRATTVVAPFVRTVLPPAGRVVARWQDGEPAATEVALGNGCLRFVPVTLPPAGDLALSPAFRRFAERMVVGCGATRSWLPVSDTIVAAAFTPARDAARPATESFDAVANPASSRLSAWLLGFALLAALGEMALRRGGTHATT